MSTSLYRIDNPRITGIFALPGGAVISLMDWLIAALGTNAVAIALFTEETVPNQAGRLALTGKSNGYTIYQTTGAAFYELIDDTDPTVNGNWRAVTVPQLRNYTSFIKNISWKVREDSSIGNASDFTTYVMNGFMNQVAPTSGAMTTYGVPLVTDTERTFSGHAKHYFLYSASGTNILVDIVFETGAA